MNALSQISKIAGHQVEMTIRGDRNFTFSFDAADQAAAQRIVDFFGKDAQCEVAIDDECGTFVYVNA